MREVFKILKNIFKPKEKQKHKIIPELLKEPTLEEIKSNIKNVAYPVMNEQARLQKIARNTKRFRIRKKLLKRINNLY